MRCTYLGDLNFRVANEQFDVEIQLSCEVVEARKGDIHVYAREDGDLTFDEVNAVARTAIINHLKAAGLAPKKKARAR